MAPPKKTLDKVQKPPIRRIRKTKPPLKTPTIIRIPIPVRKETDAPVVTPKLTRRQAPQIKLDLANEVSDAPVVTQKLTRKQYTPRIKIDLAKEVSDAPVVTQKLTRKQLTPQIKLDLANEVARAQLTNEPIIFDEPKKQSVKRRGRPKTVVSDFFLDSKVIEEPEIKTDEKVLNEKVTPAKTKFKEKAVPKKRQADSTVKKPIKRRRLIPQADTLKKKLTDTNNISPRVTRRSYKGKQEGLAADGRSPSILAGFEISPKKEIDSKSSTDVPTLPVKVASLIGSRKASINSTASSGPSWIRDISSTSTTTCVTVSSNEFVRFNYKLPVIQLTNIDSKVGTFKNNDCVESSSSDSESDSSDSEDKYPEQLDSCIGLSSPKLSVTSSSDSQAPNTEADKNEKVTFFLDKLESVLKKIDMEIINGLRFDNEDISADLKRLKNKLFDIVNNEFGIINQCKHVIRILDPQNTENKDIAEIPRVNSNQGVEFLAPDTHTKDSNDFQDRSFNINVKNITDKDKDSSAIEPTHHDLENVTTDKFNYVRYDHCDDDDALSLFAESITGMDSSRLNSSVVSMSDVHSEEYIPQPVKSTFESPDKYVYCPTKIVDGNNSTKPKTICEKQNADSTSIHRESLVKHEHENIVINDKPAINENRSNKEVNLIKNHPSSLILSQYRSISIRQSIVFQGVCFYNMINRCYNSTNLVHLVDYPHALLDTAEIKDRLATINEEWFIQEYVTMRTWKEMRRLYGMCFVNECVRRELTRILVEMSLDFVKKANTQSREDSELQLQVVETTLLHLNNVGLRECEDLLKYHVKSGTQLCDFFMETIARTQNFSRFKDVFINLALYMVRNESTFCISVASSILERVCILPYDEGLARTLLEIIKLTSRKIFESSMIGHFEKQIASNKELLEDYWSTKFSRQSVVTPVLLSPNPPSPRMPLTLAVEQAMSRPEDEDAAFAPSPDTTAYDIMNKNTDEPEVTRTLNFTQAHSHNPNVPPTFISPNSSQLQRVIRKGLPAVNNWNTSDRVHPYTRRHFSPQSPNFGPSRPHFGPRGPHFGPRGPHFGHRGPHFGLQRPHFSTRRPPRPLGSPKRVVTYAENPAVCRYTPRRQGPNY